MLADRCRKLLDPGSSSAAAIDETSRAIRQGLDLLSEIGDRSELTLDPELGSYYFIALFLWKLPQHAEQVALAWSRLAASPAGQPVSAETRDGSAAHFRARRFSAHGQANEALAKAWDGAPGAGRHLRIPPSVGTATTDPMNQALNDGHAQRSNPRRWRRR